MAFNFNWSPLIADTSRARDMLTTALNKSPKPPIIVDDIIVTELNLGSIPPELEILEIGDLAEDRFRGIFKMSYTGDAFLTLKTKVQANPLNTYLSAKPTFASPDPLAASSGLVIPLQITLSDIRLSGFVILVFSKQKGITLVFRNDPLESLKVSSTFDSIPFVRNYLQKEIEAQLRVLFMEDLPAIIHRLSLRLWSPDHQQKRAGDGEVSPGGTEGEQMNAESHQEPIDPLSSPPQDPIDDFGRPIDDSDLSLLDPSAEAKVYANFSQRNLLKLAALTDSYSTLSLFTPSMRDVVFRAWAGTAERRKLSADGLMSPVHNHARSSLTLASLSRIQQGQTHGSSTSLASGSAYSASETSSSPHASRRPSVAGGLSSFRSGTSVSSGLHARNGGHKRKHRVVDLRRRADPAEAAGEASSSSAAAAAAQISRPTTPTPSTTDSSSSQHSSSLYLNANQHYPQTYNHQFPQIIREGELDTPPDSPEKTKRTPRALQPATSSIPPLEPLNASEVNDGQGQDTIRASSRLRAAASPVPASTHLLNNVMLQPSSNDISSSSDDANVTPRQPSKALRSSHATGTRSSQQPPPPSYSANANPSYSNAQPQWDLKEEDYFHRAAAHVSSKRPSISSLPPSMSTSGTPAGSSAAGSGGSILEQAWMVKMASEIARRVADERDREMQRKHELQLQQQQQQQHRETAHQAHSATDSTIGLGDGSSGAGNSSGNDTRSLKMGSGSEHHDGSADIDATPPPAYHA